MSRISSILRPFSRRDPLIWAAQDVGGVELAIVIDRYVIELHSIIRRTTPNLKCENSISKFKQQPWLAKHKEYNALALCKKGAYKKMISTGLPVHKANYQTYYAAMRKTYAEENHTYYEQLIPDAAGDAHQFFGLMKLRRSTAPSIPLQLKWKDRNKESAGGFSFVQLRFTNAKNAN